ncbi:MAG: T9SS type A sorting domain-containing protein [Bacteroidia bacterium]|nr:T9SS type A sorting domain-containing protein [Bacteroidia bacterium]
MKKISTLFIGLAFPAAILSQNAGWVDSSFATSGIFYKDFGAQDNLTTVLVQPDGKIVSAGTALTPAFSGQLLLIRQNADGSLDNTFNDTGSVTFTNFQESYAYALANEANQQLLVAGTSADPNYAFSGLVAKLNANGNLVPEFGTGGWVNYRFNGDTYFYSMKVLQNHQILLAGTAIDTAYNNVPIVVRLNENGSLDSTFGVNGVASVPVNELDNRFNKLVVHPDGSIFAAGHFGNPITIDGQTDFDILVAKFTPSGQPDSSFSGDGILIDRVSNDYLDDIFGLALTDNGSVIIAGYTTKNDFSYDAILLQYDENGVLDNSFATNGLYRFDAGAQDVFSDVLIQDDGSIVAVGTSGGFFFDNRDFLVIRLKDNGNTDSQFGVDGVVTTEIMGFMDEANAVCLDSDGKLIVAGKTNNGDQNDACVVRYWGQGDDTGVDLPLEHRLNLYPNPVHPGQPIQIQSNAKFSQFEISDARGTLVYSKNLSLGSGSMTFQLPTLHSGLYFVKIDNQVVKLLVD